MESLRFDGSGWEYFKIWIVNILLIILTLGFYYPWAKVRNRRYFYANSILDGRNFEYHATGKQLFLGYLIALIAFIIFSSGLARFGSLAILATALVKVFIFDLGALDGALRAASFIGLGATLLGTALFYQRFVFNRGDRAGT